MTKNILNTDGYRTYELMEHYYQLMARNHRQLAKIADDLAGAALAQADQRRFNDLHARQDKLLAEGNEIQTEMEKLMRLPLRNR